MQEGMKMKNANIMRTGFIAEGTICESCASIIKRQAMKVHGVTGVEFDYATETGSVTFDKKKTDINKILTRIEEKGYSCFILDEKYTQHQGRNAEKSSNTLGWIFGILGILVALYFILPLAEGIQLPQISQNMGYGLLF